MNLFSWQKIEIIWRKYYLKFFEMKNLPEDPFYSSHIFIHNVLISLKYLLAFSLCIYTYI